MTTIGAHDLFAARARQTPDAAAIRFQGVEIGYRELDERANRLAHELRALGVGPERVVGICVERSPRFVIAMLAVLKAGGAFLNLEPAYPVERLRFMLEDAGARVVLVEERTRGRAAAPGVVEVDFDAIRSTLAQRPTEAPPVETAPEGLAYIAYTSGSTGRPKGTLITQRGLCNTALSHGFRPGSRVLQFASPGFDASISEAFCALSVGACLVLAPREDLLVGEPLQALLSRERINVATLTPSALSLLDPEPLVDLELVLSLGEACTTELAKRWSAHCKFINGYGPTEASICATLSGPVDPARPRCIGRPIPNVEAHVLDALGQPVPRGVPGELYLGGAGVSRGYLGRPSLTAEFFIPHPFSDKPGARLYRTGDMVRWLPDGQLEFIGRRDAQVKIRGMRVELGEIESVLSALPEVREAVVAVRADERGHSRLVAYVVPAPSHSVEPTSLRARLRAQVPEHMVPSAFVTLSALPLSASGKVERHALPDPEPEKVSAANALPESELERRIASIWCEVLQRASLGIHDNFFDLGGHSLLLARVHRRLEDELGVVLSEVELYQYPTVFALARRLGSAAALASSSSRVSAHGRPADEPIAIVGVACRFPGAEDAEAFWQNLCEGIESITTFSDEELLAHGVSAELLSDPHYVKAAGAVEGVDRFDAAFFGFSPRDAALLDPQHRLFLECAWHALENAGCDPRRYAGEFGVFAGAGTASYYHKNIIPALGLHEDADGFLTHIANHNDFLATLVSYKLDLKGPSLSVQTACSTSLVAVDMACQSLRAGRCQVALAGAITLLVPPVGGYLAPPGMIFSQDGHCRAFDARAQGTVPGSGVGVCVLKPLSRALADGDSILALIRGSATNNDGANKVGYTAPSVDGQRAVITAALTQAGVTPASIGYVEAHGTGTAIGDPIEVRALSAAFHGATEASGRCALGSVKTNIGHADSAAGMAGLIKAVFAVSRGQIPPSLHYAEPNPRIDFERGPFYVNTRLSPWPKEDAPRRAGVSSFGIGGTNAHVILEQAPEPPPSEAATGPRLLVLSAATNAALARMEQNLGAHLRAHPELSLADVAFTLAVGRRALAHRRAWVCASLEDAAAKLEGSSGAHTAPAVDASGVAFLFPGQGTRHLAAAARLFEEDPVFRGELEHCATLLRPHVAWDPIDLLHSTSPEAKQKLGQTEFVQPLLFMIDYALARRLGAFGVAPRAMLGHSLGEYVAACLAGVFTLGDALALVAARGRLMQGLTEGAMLSVHLPEAEALSLCGAELSLAVVNGPSLCVLAGPIPAIEALERTLSERSVRCGRLEVSHAFHSAMMEPMMRPFSEVLARTPMKAPTVPFVSNVTGTWITPEEACSPAYWLAHLRQTVRFGEALAALAADPRTSLLEVGPGRSLAALATAQTFASGPRRVVSCLPTRPDEPQGLASLLSALGQLWEEGASPDWDAVHAHERRRRVPLPGYPFERQRYWIEPPSREHPKPDAALALFAPQHEEAEPRAAKPSVEQVLSKLWQELLGVAAVDADSDFFELGGHSLLATQLISRIHREFQLGLTQADIFEAKTITKLARLIDRRLASAAESMPALRTMGAETAPLSLSQHRLWLLDRLEPGSSSYNVSALVRLEGELSPALLERCLREIVQRHEALRTTFEAEGDAPVQRVAPEARLHVSALDFSSLGEEEASERLQRSLEEEENRPFDLARGPLLRVTWARLPSAKHALLVVMHHIVTDGWSLGILWKELGALYGAYAAGRPSPLPALPLQYADFATWQRTWLVGDRLEGQLSYWRRQLGDAPEVLDLPLDKPRPSRALNRVASVPMRLPERIVGRMQKLSREEAATPFMVLLSAFYLLLHRYAGQDDICVGTPAAGRSRVELEGLIGFFINTLVLRGRIDAARSFRELLAQTKQTTLDAYAHQEVPFEKLVEELRPARALSRSPLFQVMFALENVPLSDLELPGLKAQPLEVSIRTGQFDLVLVLWDRRGSYEGELQYSLDLFEPQTAERMARHFEALLETALMRPEESVSRLSLLTDAERREILDDWRGVEREDAATQRRAHLLIAGRARQIPDAPAIRFQGSDISFRELDERANQLAHHLRGLGVGSEGVVGICVERSPRFVIAMLGILKAGGAFLNLDPAYPADRLRFMLEDAGATLLLDEQRTRGKAAAPGVAAIDFDAIEAALEKLPKDAPAVEVWPESLAYVIYTSGSTGRPKGTLVTHQGLSNTALSHGYWRGARVLQFASAGFDASISETFCTLADGACVVLAPRDQLLVGEPLQALLSRERINIVTLTPSVLSLLQPDPLVDLELVLSLGEACTAELVDQWGPHCKFINGYGPTEVSICATLSGNADAARPRCIGRPIPNAETYVLDAFGQPVPCGVTGELYVGGAGVARGYLGRASLTAERFVPHPFSDKPGARLYRTGDMVRWLPSGELEFVGRRDSQVKIRGMRVELTEIDAVLATLPGVREAVVTVREDNPGHPRLVAYVVPALGQTVDAASLRARLRAQLPEHMVPSDFVALDALPLSPSGKLDRRALPAPEPEKPAAAPALPEGDMEPRIAAIWRDLLHRESVGLHDNFFDLGGHSLMLVELHRRLEEALGAKLSVVDLFEFPTVAALARHLRPEEGRGAIGPSLHASTRELDQPIAIIGLSCRFPRARDAEAFWQNLCDGIECITTFSDEELLASGIPAELLRDPHYVKAAGAVEDVDQFDAAFFGFSPRDAALLDPQHRLFLECAWHALEDAGCDPQRHPGAIGVFAGAGQSAYFRKNILPALRGPYDANGFQAAMSNQSDFLATQVSYKLNLKGPSYNVQTACSTSLVAVDLACQSLRSGRCQVALAGGVSLHVPRTSGYLFQEGMIFSDDGHCRAFDARAKGIVPGSGVGVLVLKPLSLALADGDRIIAVIRGSATNNDGSAKVGFTAPSVEGQRAVIAAALDQAGISPASIGYVEAHGTGTALGDPIEVAALTAAYREQTQETGYCALGSVKTNIGHADSAAGAAGLIKAAFAVSRGALPPSLHFAEPNPRIDFAHSPFYVNASLSPWPAGESPRRAGVSSFGIGGTNAHVILEQPPEPPPSDEATGPELLVLSAATEAALARMEQNLAAHLRTTPDLNLADVAHTLQVGRRVLAHRRAYVCSSLEDAVVRLEAASAARGAPRADASGVAFLFPGQGTRHLAAVARLLDEDPVFRAEIERCAQLLRPHLTWDPISLLRSASPEGQQEFGQTEFVQPLLFMVDYALAQRLRAWGVEPRAMLGHSLGEYVAACLAGVFTLEDALALVAARGRLMQRLPRGAMLSVHLPEGEALALCGDELSLAVVNAPSLCVLAGPIPAIEALERTLEERAVRYARLEVSHAFHSAMMEPMMGRFSELLARTPMKAPTIPFVSNVTGTFITPEEACSPEYWLTHLRRTVRFAEGLATLAKDPSATFLEVGPGRSLATIAAACSLPGGPRRVVSCLPTRAEEPQGAASLLSALGQLWEDGISPNWAAVHAGERRRRVPLPGYPFERNRYWIEPPAGGDRDLRKKPDPAEWFHVPAWTRAPRPPARAPRAGDGACWMVLAEEGPVGAELANSLAARGERVITVRSGSSFRREADERFVIDRNRPEDYARLLKELEAEDRLPTHIVHTWCLEPESLAAPSLSTLPGAMESSLHGLLFLARALGSLPPDVKRTMTVITSGAHDVTGDEAMRPQQAMAVGAVKIIPLEYPHLGCRNIDVSPSGSLGLRLDLLLAELRESAPTHPVVAFRGPQRWLPRFEPVRLEASDALSPRLQHRGVYLITGGLGGVGLGLASFLARSVEARLVLVGRTPPDETKLRRIHELETLGAEVMTCVADVSQLDAMTEVLAQARRRFGKIHGIVHAAGVIDDAGVIHRRTREATEAAMAAKVQGTLVLDALLGDEPLDFFVLCSTLGNVLYRAKFGQVGYAAANEFLDAYASYRAASRPGLTVSINWDDWVEEGMSVEAQHRASYSLGTLGAEDGLTSAEGAEVFRRILCHAFSRVIVAVRDLDRLIAMPSATKALEEVSPEPTVSSERDERRDAVMPASVESALGNLWRELLGVPEIGPDDDFFVLGGHSLLATQLIARIRQSLSLELTLADVFEGPTVNKLAHRIAARRARAPLPPEEPMLEGEEEGVL